ncbi:MAG: cupin protein [Polaromonas sp.]|nr:cupin protein [Polaromonas sp.]
MAIEHAASGQVVDLLPAATLPVQAQSTAICKTRDLEVMRLVIPAGRSVPLHHVRGDLTVQCLQGAVTLAVGEEARRLSAGQFLWLSGGVPYSIQGVQDAMLLVTVAMPAADKYA